MEITPKDVAYSLMEILTKAIGNVGQRYVKRNIQVAYLDLCEAPSLKKETEKCL
tara:strand:- start:32 stop:193 length:162 start_codon:yes stop_codon:yes gene_type:complete